jgi:hypothetical protein
LRMPRDLSPEIVCLILNLMIEKTDMGALTLSSWHVGRHVWRVCGL